jgi:hypothetical protein
MLFVPFGDMFGFCGMGLDVTGATVDGAPTNLGTAPRPGTDGMGTPATGDGASVTIVNASAVQDADARRVRRNRRLLGPMGTT